jgi:YHS domain-containing protein
MKRLLPLLLIALVYSTAQAQTAAERTRQYNVPASHLAIEGYDPVAYFNQSKAVKGNKAFAVSHEGIVYHFANAQNKELFKANPARYEPQYGGWCAYAMGATGEKVEVDPETFKIVQGKLYLFYHSWINNTLTKWNNDEANLKGKADANWKKFIQP